MNDTLRIAMTQPLWNKGIPGYEGTKVSTLHIVCYKYLFVNLQSFLSNTPISFGENKSILDRQAILYPHTNNLPSPRKNLRKQVRLNIVDFTQKEEMRGEERRGEGRKERRGEERRGEDRI